MAGSLNTQLGSIVSHLPFPLDETRPSTVSNLANRLGETFDLGSGSAAKLVQHKAAAQTGASGLILEYTDSSAHIVQVTSATGDIACGVTPPVLADIASGDYFLMLVPSGKGAFRFSAYDSGAGVTKNDLVQSTAGGLVITDAIESDRATLGVAMETAAASAFVDIMAFTDAFVGNNV